MVALAVATLAAPSMASAGSIHFGGFQRYRIGWTHQIRDYRPFLRHRFHRFHNHQGPNKDGAVPEPTAALLFGLGAAVVAVRNRKRR
jgi:hypothetical protein